MIYVAYYTGRSEQDCFDQINRDDKYEDDDIITIDIMSPQRCEGWDEYDTWIRYRVRVIYKG